jgi:tight adherence protein B
MNGTTLTMLWIMLSGAAALAALATWAYDAFLRDRWRIDRRFAEEFASPADAHIKRSPLFRDLKLLHAQTTRSRVGLRAQFDTLIEQSGLATTPENLLVSGAAIGIALAAAAWLATPLPILALPVGLAGAASPLLFVVWRRRARISRLCRQLPEAFEQMKRAVKAGQTVSAALQLVANDMQAPLADEFAICCQQQQLGLPFPSTLQNLAQRTGVMELRMFAVALLVQRESGGNCTELFNHLSEMVRKRLHLVLRVKALTGEGRLQATVLGLLPLAAFASILLLKPDYGAVLLQRPYLLLVVGLSEIVGALWIRRIVSIEY